MLGTSTHELSPALLEKNLEMVCVELLGPNVQHIAGRLRLEQLVAVAVHEQAPQPREIGAEYSADRCRSCLSPELVDQPIARDDRIGVQEEEAE
jgi:hypothetical protein